MMNLKVSYKSVIAVLLVAAMLTTIYSGAVGSAFISGTTSKSTNYIVMEGTAGSDTYDSMQYSYAVNSWAAANIAGYPAITVTTPAANWFNASKSLRLGMTEYGELTTPANAGLAYGANSAQWNLTESEASSAINPQYYMQGWTFYMNYTRVGVLRAVEAWSIFSNTSATETGRNVYSWDGTKNPTDINAQLTQGSLSPSGIEVLYDSARLEIARSTVVIHDAAFNENVAQVTVTVVFNKDTKYAILYKDVKMLLDTKILDNINDLAFSERYEIDLARNANPSNQAYIHYYSAFGVSSYQYPLTGSKTYDVVQAFNPSRNYTFFAGYWPSTTEYAVYYPIVPSPTTNFTSVMPPGTKVADILGSPAEPTTPWVIAQWQYNNTFYPGLLNFMAKSPNREMRFVEVMGMTDYNMYTGSAAAAAAGKAFDVQAGDGKNQVDAEVQYLLASVFNPADLSNGANGVNANTFQWTGLGQPSAATDSAGASVVSDIQRSGNLPFPLFDKADTLGTIPYGLSNQGVFNGSTSGLPYIESFSNAAKGTGSDTTTYWREGLNGFAFNYYDAGTSARSPPQPIAGGFSYPSVPAYWYPSINPLVQRWNGLLTAMSPYVAAGAANPNGILVVGGPKANQLARYFNDFGFAIDREGTSAFALVSGGTVTGSAPTSNPTVSTFDFFPVSTWATSHTTFFSNPSSTSGLAVISLANDINGTRSLSVYGWNGRDTYWASAWATMYLSPGDNAWVPAGTVAIILQITYTGPNNEPTAFTVVKDLGTITELGSNAFTAFDAVTGPATWTSNVAPPALPTGYEGTQWWYAKLPTTSTASVQYDP